MKRKLLASFCAVLCVASVGAPPAFAAQAIDSVETKTDQVAIYDISNGSATVKEFTYDVPVNATEEQENALRNMAMAKLVSGDARVTRAYMDEVINVSNVELNMNYTTVGTGMTRYAGNYFAIITLRGFSTAADQLTARLTVGNVTNVLTENINKGGRNFSMLITGYPTTTAGLNVTLEMKTDKGWLDAESVDVAMCS